MGGRGQTGRGRRRHPGLGVLRTTLADRGQAREQRPRGITDNALRTGSSRPVTAVRPVRAPRGRFRGASDGEKLTTQCDV